MLKKRGFFSLLTSFFAFKQKIQTVHIGHKGQLIFQMKQGPKGSIKLYKFYQTGV